MDTAKHSRLGCFFCLEEYQGNEITEWVDEGKTPICPTCGVDSVDVLEPGEGHDELVARKSSAFPGLMDGSYRAVGNNWDPGNDEATYDAEEEDEWPTS